MPKTFKKSACSFCGQMIAPQGMKTHVKAKHPQVNLVERITPDTKKQPVSIDIEEWKRGYKEGLLEGLGKAA